LLELLQLETDCDRHIIVFLHYIISNINFFHCTHIYFAFNV